MFTEDAIHLRGGAKNNNWGIIGASLQRADVPDALGAQDCLYTVETLDDTASYRVIGVLQQALFAPRDTAALLGALSSPDIHAVTLTLSEKGYCLDAHGELDITPVRIRCTPATLAKGEKWYQVPRRRPHFRIEVDETIAVTPFIAGAASHALAARHLNRHLTDHFSKEHHLASA